MTYTLLEHRHRFSVWAAARGAQRGLKEGGVGNLRGALEQSGVVDFARSEVCTLEGDRFDDEHRRWCRSIVDYLASRGVNAGFGRAAKLIAIYLKGMVVLGAKGETESACIIHPPIDRILLRNLCRASDQQSAHKAAWKRLRWTELSEDEYYRLIKQLRMCVPEGQPFWLLERYWTVTEDDSDKMSE